MDEGDLPPVGALARSVVDQANPGGPEAVEGAGNIVHGIGDVMRAGTAFGEVATNGTFWIGGANELHIARSGTIDDRLNALLGNGKAVALAKPDALVIASGLIEVVDDDADVVQPEVTDCLVEGATHRPSPPWRRLRSSSNKASCHPW